MTQKEVGDLKRILRSMSEWPGFWYVAASSLAAGLISAVAAGVIIWTLLAQREPIDVRQRHVISGLILEVSNASGQPPERVRADFERRFTMVNELRRRDYDAAVDYLLTRAQSPIER